MRILIYSNAVWANTGYGKQTKYVVRTLTELGHTVGLFANHGLQGGCIHGQLIEGSKQPLTIYPLVADNLGREMMIPHFQHFKADLFLMHYDIWPFAPNLAQLPRPYVVWFPVDHTPCQAGVVKTASQAITAITQTKWAQKMLTEQRGGLDSCEYVPASVDCDTHKPGDRAEARREWCKTNGHIKVDPQLDFIVGMVARNHGKAPTRKAFPETFEAFARFRADLPRDEQAHVKFYLHAVRIHPEGMNLESLVRQFGMLDCFISADQHALMCGIGEEHMATMYRSLDVLTAASYGEGFGVPILEAQANGCRVITNASSSGPELTWDGECAEPVSEQGSYTPQEAWQFQPSVEGIRKALHSIYRRRHEPFAQSALVKAKEYDRKVVAYRHWGPTMKKIEEKMGATAGGWYGERGRFLR